MQYSVSYNEHVLWCVIFLTTSRSRLICSEPARVNCLSYKRGYTANLHVSTVCLTSEVTLRTCTCQLSVLQARLHLLFPFQFCIGSFAFTGVGFSRWDLRFSRRRVWRWLRFGMLHRAVWYILRNLLPPSQYTLITETVSFSETSVISYHTIRCNVPEDSHLHRDLCFTQLHNKSALDVITTQ
jgi:hypothetical protein